MPEEEIERSEYLEHRKTLLDLKRESAISYDRAFILFSGGALAYSIPIAKTISPETNSKILFLIAWLLFGISLALTLVSYYRSQNTLQKAIDSWDACYEKSEHKRLNNLAGIGKAIEDYNLAEQVLQKRMLCKNILEIGALAFLILGIFSLIIVAFINL